MLGAILNFTAAAMHIAIIVGGGAWYRFFGAGEAMARAAEAGKLYPHFMTAGIAFVLMLWGLYALSGAEVIPRLPLLKLALITITTIYLLRGLLFPFISSSDSYSASFIAWSSIICAGYGLVHLVGTSKSWAAL